MSKQKLVVFDGPDNAGKSTMINFLRQKLDKEIIVFKNDINVTTAKEFELLKLWTFGVSANKVIFMDRGPFSNIAYERNDDHLEHTLAYRDFLHTTFDVLEIVMMRNRIHDGSFEDDKITMSSTSFNRMISNYEKIIKTYEPAAYKLLEHGAMGEFIKSDMDVQTKMLEYISVFLNESL